MNSLEPGGARTGHPPALLVRDGTQIPYKVQQKTIGRQTPNTICASIFNLRLISRAILRVGSHLPEI